MANVVLKHLGKRYPNGLAAVWDVNLEIADGELLVLVGPSGSGKTTTLRLIAGLEEPTGGEIYVGEQLMNGVAPGKRDIAMVFQSHALYPHMSVYQNMAFGLKMRRTPRAEINRRVRQAAEALSIEPLLQRRPQELSGGQQQRVALGRAIVREPKVFLFDEPLSNLDAQLRVQLRAEISRLHRQVKTTMIYVTHDQAEAMTLGERIVVLNNGSLQQTGTPLDIYQRPANQFVASFIGSPTMNFLAGKVGRGVFELDASAEVQASTIAIDSAIPDGPAVLGVRPEDFLFGTSDCPFAAVMVDTVERLGHETFAHFRLAGAEHIARLPVETAVQSNERVTLSIRPGAIHLFSLDGRRLN